MSSRDESHALVETTGTLVELVDLDGEVTVQVGGVLHKLAAKSEALGGRIVPGASAETLIAGQRLEEVAYGWRGLAEWR